MQLTDKMACAGETTDLHAGRGSCGRVDALVRFSLGLPMYLVFATLLRAFHERRPRRVVRSTDASTRTADAFRGIGVAGLFVRGYVRGKLMRDPVYRQLASGLPLPSPVVDLGSGLGQTLVWLAAMQPDVEGVGVEADGRKVSLAVRAGCGLALRFETGDLTKGPPPHGRTFLLLDVLHYLPLPAQDRLLRDVARAVPPGGRIYVRDVDAAAGWRATVNVWQERLAGALHVHRGRTLAFRPAREIEALLREEGLVVATRSSREGTPLANVLIEAERPLAGPLAAS